MVKLKPSIYSSTITAIILTTIGALLLLAITLYHGNQTYKQNFSQGYADASTLTTTLATHIEQTILTVENTLKRATERQRINQLFGENLNTDMKHHFNIWLANSPYIAALAIMDDAGNVTISTKKEGYAIDLHPEYSLGHKDFFIQHQQGISAEHLLTPSDELSMTGNPFIIVSDAIYGINGRFEGIIFAMLDVDYIIDLLLDIESNQQSFMRITTADNTILAEYLDVADQGRLFDTAIANVNANQLPPKQIAAFFAETPSIDDNTETDITLSHGTLFYQNSEMPFNAELVQNNTLIDSRPLTSNTINDSHIISMTRLINPDILLTISTKGNHIFAPWISERHGYILVFIAYALIALLGITFAVRQDRQMQRVRLSEKAALLANKTKSDFLAKMSHELRTPLNSIIGFSEMLRSGYFGTLNDKQSDRIYDINFCGTHLLELINDILEFSKGDAGETTLQESEVDITKTVIKAIRIVQQRAKTSGITIQNELKKHYGYRLYIDERKIRQILLNLLTNSVKFTPAGGVISISADIDKDKNFILSIQDTGVGIAKQDIPKALSVFGQVHEESKYEGTGLGLPLSKMFIELHGGKLVLSSIKGTGTSVILIFPAERILWSKKPSLPRKESRLNEEPLVA